MVNPSSLFIAGVSGFIGSRLARRCLTSGYQVSGMSRGNAELLSKELGIDVVKADLLEVSQINSVPLNKSDIIVHCATANDIVSKSFNAGVSLSVMGTRNLFEAALRAGVKRVVLFSTAQVYGTELFGLVDEFSPVRCETPYALNHFFAEELGRLYAEKQGFDVTVIRPSNVYGVPQVSAINRSTLVPMCFVEEAIKQGSITLHSSGKQTRNFVSNDEVAELVLKVLSSFPTGFTIINACSNYHASIFDIAGMVASSFKTNYRKKAAIHINGSQPLSPNVFRYSSKFYSPSADQSLCSQRMSSVINQLFVERMNCK